MFGAVMNYGGLELPTDEFKIERADRRFVEEMASGPMMLRLLQCLIGVRRPKKSLEIGAFLGISAMFMAKALGEVGRLVSIEKFDHFAGIARRNFAANGLSEKIKLIHGDAFE